MTLVWSCFWFMASLLTLALLVHGQPGFLGIDCGIPDGLNYTDDTTQMVYTSDAKYIDTGINQDISAGYMTQTVPQQFRNLRHFPDGTRNCYTLTPVNKSSRFPDDAYDRVWYPWGKNPWTLINTSSPINLKEGIGYQPPQRVMNTAVIPSESSENFTFNFPTVDLNKSFQYQIFMHFAELEQLRSNELRQFNIFIDGVFAHGPFSPVYLSADTIFIYSALNGLNKHVIDFWKTTTSTLPPILNAVETFILQPLSAPPTDSRDVDAIMNIKTRYNIRRNWMGDPCLPASFLWEGLNCNCTHSKPPTIISLDLSSSGLTGEVSPLLSNLTSLQFLDVSNNRLTGPVPNFLTELTSLKFLNLSNNNLTGTIPTVLQERSNNGSLSLSIDNNPHLVGSSIVPVNNNIIPCQGGACKKRRKTVVHIVAPVILALIMLIVMVYVFRRINQRRRQRDPVVQAINASGPLLYGDQQITSPEDPVVEANNTGGPLLFQHQQITSSEANHVVEAHRTGSPLPFEIQLITSPKDPVEETNNTGDALLSAGRQIVSTNGGSFIYEVPRNIAAADTEGMPHNQEPISVHVQEVLDPDPVIEANIIGSPLLLEDRRITAPEDPVVNETGSLLLTEDKWITCPEDPVVKFNETGSSLLSKNRPFTYDEVSVITNDFKRFLGKGAFGQVFYGEMTDGTEVTKLAVKKLFPQSVKLLSDLSKQFENEAQLLMRVHHRNLVPFIGYCQEGDNMALIYEYMAQGDLGSLLGKNSNSKALNWDQRLHIGLDVAQGLEYLHDGCNPPIIHRDIKTANILLNERLEAKIGDFGLSKVFLMYDESSHISTGIKGTEGYIDPEYDTSKHLTKKSDVYSFGVVLFQLITALPAIMKRDGPEKKDLVDWVNPIIAQGAIKVVVDPKLEAVHDASLVKAAEIARLCTSEKSEERPAMCEVVAKLKDCLETHAAAKVAFGSL